jgi:hypothetical protein
LYCGLCGTASGNAQQFQSRLDIWIDTIEKGRFEDTNKIFVPPEVYDFRITEQAAEKWVEFVGEHIIENRRRPTFDWQKETVQMLGRWQPWHAGIVPYLNVPLPKQDRWLFKYVTARAGRAQIPLL